jgi:hypothetical protein
MLNAKLWLATPVLVKEHWGIWWLVVCTPAENYLASSER